MAADVTDLLMDERDSAWLAEYQDALGRQPEELGAVGRIRGALDAMGYVRTHRPGEPIDWRELAACFHQGPSYLADYPEDQQAEFLADCPDWDPAQPLTNH